MKSYYLLESGVAVPVELHEKGECERCRIDMLLWGETMYNTKTLHHIPVQDVMRKFGKVNP
jgi:hypothetical protein